MSEREWTEKQRQGFEARGGTLLVAAAAGSGKTSVLVERIMQRITDSKEGVDVDRLLVVTFTKAAAAEMRQRLSKALGELVAKEPENPRYQRQQLMLPQAHINTVHGFCQAMLQEQAGRTALPIGFKIVEGAQKDLLSATALDEVMEEAYTRGDPAFLKLAEQLNSDRHDNDLKEAVLKAYEFMQAQPHPAAWLRSQLDAYTAVQPLEKTLWYQPLWQEMCFYLEAAEALASQEAAYTQLEEVAPYRAMAAQDLALIRDLRAMTPDTPYGEVKARLDAYKLPKKVTVRSKDSAVIYCRDRIGALRNEAADLVKSAAKLFPCDEEECRLDLAAMAPAVEALVALVEAYDTKFTAAKRQQNLLDFNDLEHELLQLLMEPESGQPTPLAVELSRRFTEIMVDEYQDTNAVQDAIFRCLSRHEENLFMVGDVKQSVYGFRQAMPEIFNSRRKSYATYDPEHPVYPATVTLEDNFRSRRQVTDTVNFLFAQTMRESMGGVEYDRREALRCGATYYEDSDDFDTEWLLLDRGQDEEEQVSKEMAEARLIAQRIRRLCRETQVLHDGQRGPVTYGDICILMRNRTHMQVYKDELMRCGIPVVADKSEDILYTREIMTAMALLRTIDNPLREIELTAVMLSPLYGFTPDQVARVRLAGGNGRQAAPLYTALGMVDGEAHPQLAAKCAALAADLARYRALAVSLPADRLLERLMADTGMEAVFAAQAGGKNRVENLHRLDQLARGFEQGEFRGLSAFVSFIDTMQEKKGGLQVMPAQPEGVRLMTMHGSKGLEYPVVFLARMFGKRNNDDAKRKLLLHHRCGIGMKLLDEESWNRHIPLPFMGVRSARLLDEQAEDVRLLYVAMTRAKEKLIIPYTDGDIRAKLAACMPLVMEQTALLPHQVAHANSTGDWLLAAAMRHPDFVPVRPDDVTSLPTNTRWQVRLESLQPVEILTEGPTAPRAVDAAWVNTLRERMAYTYPYLPLSQQPAKLAASEASHRAMSHDYIAKARPAFLQKEGMTAAQKGTALHTFMQFADLAAAATDLPAEVSRLTQGAFLSAPQAEALEQDRIRTFLGSTLYRRMAASPDCRREYPFRVLVAVGSLNDLPPSMAQEPVVVQGIADCVFREGDGLVLVDYKTDRVKAPAELVERYCTQMAFYKTALEPLLGLPVKEVWLYSFHLGQAVPVDI